MKKVFISLLSAASVIFVVMIITIAVHAIRSSSNTAMENNIEQQKASSQVYQYIMKEYNQQIGIYRNAESTPFQILNVAINTLPQQDQIELKNGIQIADEKELKKRIEDFES